MTRKEKVRYRGFTASIRDGAQDRTAYERAYFNGYRAAMKDARKALAVGVGMNSITPVELFLKPLR